MRDPERDPDPYAVLRIPRTASRAEVARAYRMLAKQLHPDLPSGSADQMRKLNWAWHVLSDPHRRAGWDAAHRPNAAASWTAETRTRTRPTVRSQPGDASWTGWAEYRDGDERDDPVANMSLGCIAFALVVVLMMVFVLLAGLASVGGVR